MRLKRALDEFVVDGIETTLPLFRNLVRNQDIIDGNYHIHWLEHFLAEGGMDAYVRALTPNFQAHAFESLAISSSPSTASQAFVRL